MIDIENVWVPQMIGYADLIADQAKLQSAFNQQSNALWTSVTSYDELVCQVFDDLDARGMLPALGKSSVDESLKGALETFVRHFDSFDKNLEGPEPDLASAEWAAVEEAARVVVLTAGSGRA